MLAVETLRRYPFFAGLNPDTLNRVAEISHEIELPAGQILFQEGDPALNLFIVARGEMDIGFELSWGEKRVVDHVVAGEILSWSALLPPYRVTATAVARCDSRLIALDAEGLRVLRNQDDALGHRLMTEVARSLAHRLHGAHTQLAAVESH